MTDEILTDAGVLHRKARFLRMPEEAHAVYFEDIETDGADLAGAPRIRHHSDTIELYGSTPAQLDVAEAAIERELDARGLLWTKQDRYWVQEAQRYQVIYEYDYTTKS